MFPAVPKYVSTAARPFVLQAYVVASDFSDNTLKMPDVVIHLNTVSSQSLNDGGDTKRVLASHHGGACAAAAGGVLAARAFIKHDTFTRRELSLADHAIYYASMRMARIVNVTHN